VGRTGPAGDNPGCSSVVPAKARWAVLVAASWLPQRVGQAAARAVRRQVGPAAIRAAASPVARWLGQAAATSGHRVVGPAARWVGAAIPALQLAVAAMPAGRPVAGQLTPAVRMAARQVRSAAANLVGPLVPAAGVRSGRPAAGSVRFAAARAAGPAARPAVGQPAGRPSADPAWIRVVARILAVDPLARWAHPARSLTFIPFSCIRPRICVRERRVRRRSTRVVSLAISRQVADVTLGPVLLHRSGRPPGLLSR
jgi:hypothetical protein